MNRRTFLALSASGTVGFAGCGRYQGPLNVWPNPSVVDHFRGDPHVETIERTFVLDDEPDRYRAVIRNGGHGAAVQVGLYWVPDTSVSPSGLTRTELASAGFTRAAAKTVQIPAGEQRDVTLRGRQPTSANSYYVWVRNTTYGATIANDGGTGPVEARLLDATDPSGARTLATETVTIPAEESRDVSFQTAEEFESFRVDVSTTEG
ncbi:hypothetical protein ACFR9U_17525 [Halorientalis brevis]|uniref:Uncharacterized protein n=1 Tax=Halorientalis brevis TaxID=1126241 RepID=A0ABD6CGG8_9EURY|nr:hypothetical protein [Halorientalis brevis]